MNIQDFVKTVQKQQNEKIQKEGFTYEGIEKNYLVTVVPGKKYTKVDIGGSGKYMVDEEGNIYGIKAYGVINRRHYYGNLSTVDQYDWSGFRARKIQSWANIKNQPMTE